MKLEIGHVKKLLNTLDIPDNAKVTFLFRENILSDSGNDYQFEVTSFAVIKDEETNTIEQVEFIGVLPPEIITNELNEEPLQ